MNMDISKFNPRVLPENRYLEELQETTKDSVEKFISSVECGEHTGSQLYGLYKEYCNAEGIGGYTNTKFSSQLLYFMENGIIQREIEKKRTKKSILYVIK